VTFHEMLPAIGPNFESPDRHGSFLPQRFVESVAQFVAQAFAGHGKNIPVGFARGRFQVFARPSADVKDVALVVDQHSGRGVMLQNQLIRQGLETGRCFRFRTRLRPAGKGGAKAGGNSIGSVWQTRFAERAGLVVERANRSVKPPTVSALPRNRMPPGVRL
jgi:hypothetical protein